VLIPWYPVLFWPHGQTGFVIQADAGFVIQADAGFAIRAEALRAIRGCSRAPASVVLNGKHGARGSWNPTLAAYPSTHKSRGGRIPACREGPLIEESLDFSDVLGDAVGRQTLEEDLPITLLLDSRIEQNQQSPVFERADEAPKALL
jgi:hypothetical protein